MIEKISKKLDFKMLNKWNKLNRNLYRKFLHIIGFTNDKTSRNLFKLFQIALYAVIIVFSINMLSFFTKSFSFGTWGDFFGGVLNPILTFLTFMGLLITIILQQSELKQSRKEFQGQKEALENQEFDNKFFQMLNLFNSIKNNLQLENQKGGKALLELKNKITEKCISKEIIDRNNYIPIDNIEKFQSYFINFNEKYDESFKYYFLNLYQILKYIDKNSTKTHLLKEYSNIVRAQLSKNELFLLFYNGIGVLNISEDKYKKIIEKYSLFEHLTYRDLTSFYISVHNDNITPNTKLIDELLIKYEESAYGTNVNLIKRRNQILRKSE